MDGAVLVNRVNPDNTWDDIVFRSLAHGTPVVDEESGDILSLGLLPSPRVAEYLENPVDPDDPSAGYWMRVTRSRDHGHTWEEERAVLFQEEEGWMPSGTGSENGITLQFGEHAGRLLVPTTRVLTHWDPTMGPRERRALYYHTMAIFSDDGGKTWHSSGPFPRPGTYEGSLAELSDGRVLYSSRSDAEDALRRKAWSYDGGETWEEHWTSSLPDSSGQGPRRRFYGCKGGLIRLPIDLEGRDVILYSQLDIDPDYDRRSNVTVWASFDGARTWPIKRSVYAGPAGYSMLAAGRPGTPSEGWIFLVFEGGPRGDTILEPYQGAADYNIARFNLSWLLEGELTGDGDL